MRRSGLGFITLSTAVFGLSFGAHAETVVGKVSSAKGDVSAQSSDGTTRSLSCGDDVFAGERLLTGPDSSVGVLMGDVLTQLPQKSTLRVAHTEAGAPDATLERGRVRMVDVREGDGKGITGRLAAGGAVGALAGNDAEAYLLSEKVGDYAMFCEWDAPLAVGRGDQREVADAGDCVIAKPNERLYLAKAHEERIGASDADYCPPKLGGLVSLGPHFTPRGGVSEGPGPNLWSSLAEPMGPAELRPCDDPGAICGAIGGNIIVSEVPTTGGGGPGSGGPFPGNP